MSGLSKLDFWPRFLRFAFLEELIYWVSLTLAAGALAGSVAAVVAKRRMLEANLAAGKKVVVEISPYVH